MKRRPPPAPSHSCAKSAHEWEGERFFWAFTPGGGCKEQPYPGLLSCCPSGAPEISRLARMRKAVIRHLGNTPLILPRIAIARYSSLLKIACSVFKS